MACGSRLLFESGPMDMPLRAVVRRTASAAPRRPKTRRRAPRAPARARPPRRRALLVARPSPPLPCPRSRFGRRARAPPPRRCAADLRPRLAGSRPLLCPPPAPPPRWPCSARRRRRPLRLLNFVNSWARQLRDAYGCLERAQSRSRTHTWHAQFAALVFLLAPSRLTTGRNSVDAGHLERHSSPPKGTQSQQHPSRISPHSGTGEKTRGRRERNDGEFAPSTAETNNTPRNGCPLRRRRACGAPKGSPGSPRRGGRRRRAAAATRTRRETHHGARAAEREAVRARRRIESVFRRAGGDAARGDA